MNAIHKKIKRFGCSNCNGRFSSSRVKNKHIILCQFDSPSKTTIKMDNADTVENVKILEPFLNPTFKYETSPIASQMSG